MTAATVGLGLAEEPGGDFGDMLALEAGDFQLIRGGVAGAVWPREGRGPVGGSAADLSHVNEAGFAVGHPDDDHAMMQKSGVEARNRGFLAPCCVPVEAKTLPTLPMSEPLSQSRPV